ncbi:MAG: DUF4041 domain-containing protein [Leucobacter sp.]
MPTPQPGAHSPDGSIDEPDRHPLAERVAMLEAENAQLRVKLEQTPGDEVELNDSAVLQEVGIYKYHHPLESAAAYRDRLKELEARMADAVREKRAIDRSELFTFNNSLAQGRKLSADLSKLMLRAYNAEADNAIRSLRAGNVQTAIQRLEATRKAIAKLGALMEMEINEEFHALRVEEIELTSDWLMKKQEEREAAKEERARLREERRVQKELEDERQRLDKERAHLVNALEKLEASGASNEDLVQRIAQVDEAIQKNDFRAANIRAGYVYVISNEGAFGIGVVKIGLTRRLDPADRIAELSGASVPFRFDLHTMFFSEDAVTLENELHRHFASRALNQTNPRKEFFFATPEEVRDVLLDKVGSLLEFVDAAEATEYRQSLKAWPDTAKQLRS